MKLKSNNYDSVGNPRAITGPHEIKCQQDQPRLSARTPGEIVAMQFDDKDLFLNNGIFTLMANNSFFNCSPLDEIRFVH